MSIAAAQRWAPAPGGVIGGGPKTLNPASFRFWVQLEHSRDHLERIPPSTGTAIMLACTTRRPAALAAAPRAPLLPVGSLSQRCAPLTQVVPRACIRKRRSERCVLPPLAAAVPSDALKSVAPAEEAAGRPKKGLGAMLAPFSNPQANARLLALCTGERHFFLYQQRVPRSRECCSLRPCVCCPTPLQPKCWALWRRSCTRPTCRSTSPTCCTCPTPRWGAAGREA